MYGKGPYFLILTIYLSDFSIFIIRFIFFCIIKRILTNNIFSINASLLQKFENKIPSRTFLMVEIPPVFHEVKLADYGSENA